MSGMLPAPTSEFDQNSDESLRREHAIKMADDASIVEHELKNDIEAEGQNSTSSTSERTDTAHVGPEGLKRVVIQQALQNLVSNEARGGIDQVNGMRVYHSILSNAVREFQRQIFLYRLGYKDEEIPKPDERLAMDYGKIVQLKDTLKNTNALSEYSMDQITLQILMELTDARDAMEAEISKVRRRQRDERNKILGINDDIGEACHDISRVSCDSSSTASAASAASSTQDSMTSSCHSSNVTHYMTQKKNNDEASL